MAERQPFRVLSIDGGGIKGAYPSAVLAEFERIHGPIIDYFDLVCGTSTGGLIALALAAGKSSGQIAEFYRKKGPLIFYDHSRLRRWLLNLKQLFFLPRYSSNNLEEAVKEFIGDTMMSAAKINLCIVATRAGNWTPVIFKTNHSPRLTWPDLPMWEIALTTSAAPSFFPLQALSSTPTDHCTDGGLCANNPSLVGVIEALRLFDVARPDSNRCLELLSLGNFDSKKGIGTSNKRLSVLQWMLPLRSPRLLAALMEAQAAFTDRSVALLRECVPNFGHYVRVTPHTIPNGSVPNAEHNFRLADGRPTTILKMHDYGVIDGRTLAKTPDIVRFFTSRKQRQ